MINQPGHLNKYEFVVLASLRAHQLMAGCIPRVDGDHKKTTLAQMEVLAGKVGRQEKPGPAVGTDVLLGSAPAPVLVT